MRRTLLCVATLALGGCSVLGPLPDRSRYYTVTSVAPQAGTPPDAPAAQQTKSYGLGPVTLPTYLDRREVATRVSPTEMRYSRRARWAEPLALTVSTALLQDLTARLPGAPVIGYPWLGGSQIDYQVVIHVQRFESDISGSGVLHAQWLVTDSHTGARIVVRETEIAEPSATHHASPAVALGRFSDEIAVELRQLPPHATPRHEKAKLRYDAHIDAR